MLLQNPFEFAASDAAAEQAAASLTQPPAQDAAADLSDIDCIGEIFVGARKLDQLPGIFDQAAITGSDELLYVTLKLMDDPNERDLPEIPDALWAEFDEPPLFLRAVG